VIAVALTCWPANILYSEEDEGYIADVADLVACSAFGATPEEALREVAVARAAWMEAATAAGCVSGSCASRDGAEGASLRWAASGSAGADHRNRAATRRLS
jgi:predicted RNase H-like HicB family nuclease